MGGGGSKTINVEELFHQVQEGDKAALEKVWSHLNKDKDATLEGAEFTRCKDLVSTEIMNHIDDLPVETLRKLAKLAVPAFAQKALDPDGDGKITKDEFEARLSEALSG
eukprot:TRINITY_DN46384_c0_g1_i1.p1 TRINITY_DN46384_c0_g1~~TRINITY_DN46384_c0_g1_i1.p1  ORF type:complete len:109 (-),score=24.27 TRINITY_DN46384_c0_g1_i1:158-484(-)